MSPAGIYLEHCQEAEVLVGACLSHVAVTHTQRHKTLQPMGNKALCRPVLHNGILDMFLAHHKFSLLLLPQNPSGSSELSRRMCTVCKTLIFYCTRRYVSQRWSRQLWLAKPTAATNAINFCDISHLLLLLLKRLTICLVVSVVFDCLRWFRSSNLCFFLVWEVQLSFGKAWQGHVKVIKGPQEVWIFMAIFLRSGAWQFIVFPSGPLQVVVTKHSLMRCNLHCRPA